MMMPKLFCFDFPDTFNSLSRDNRPQCWAIHLFSLCLLVLGATSCLRYVPSRAELAKDEGGGKELELVDPEAFSSLDKQQSERLSQLVAQRGSEQASVSYRLGVGDEVEFNVFDVAELNRRVRVRPSETISLPLIGEVKASGLTEEELQNSVAESLKKFVHSPQVNVTITEYAAHKVWVVGAIYKPGPYALRRDNYSLIELLSESGGRTEKAGSVIVLIPPSPDLAPVAPGTLVNRNVAAAHGIEIYFDDIVGSANKPPLVIPLRAGDTVVVPEVGAIQVDGEVNKPGSFPLASKMSLLGAIATSGGLTYSADVQQVEVIRELGSGKKSLLTVDLEKIALQEGSDIRLRDGDVVRVPSHSGRFAARQVINVLNSFFGRFVPTPGY